MKFPLFLQLWFNNSYASLEYLYLFLYYISCLLVLSFLCITLLSSSICALLVLLVHINLDTKAIEVYSAIFFIT